jgi:hypothetical protein
VSYYKLYCESWANNWGQKWSGEKQIETRRWLNDILSIDVVKLWIVCIIFAEMMSF